MFVRILLLAIFAGAAAGVFATAVQSWRVVPLILEAERYEDAEEGGGAHSHGDGIEEIAAPEGEATWAPDGGVERTFYTGLSNVVVGIGFSLMLTAAVLLLNQSLTLSSGLVWGVAGFVVFTLAPSLGLPPELPGMMAGDLFERQYWWLATAALTAGALALFAFKRGLPFMLLGLVMIVAPHVYGAPQPVSHESVIPANLAAEFVTASVVASGLFWLFLGGLLGWLFERNLRKDEAET
jgi:cobalt transporter subunit CbtA